MHERGLDIAPKQHRALAGKRILDRVRQPVDRANCSRAERDANQEDREAREAAAQIPERQAKLKRQAEPEPAPLRRGADGGGHA